VRIEASLPGSVGRKHGVTDKDGRYSLRGLPSGEVAVTAAVRGYDPRIQQKTFAFPEDAEAVEGTLDFTFSPGCSVSGRVIARTGRTPLQWATVVAESPGLFETVEVRTDGDGRYRFAGLPSGKTTLFARAKGYARSDERVADLVSGSAVDGMDFELLKGACVSGRVSGPDREVMDRVFVLAEAGDGDVGTRKVVTREDGTFEITDLPPGRYRLRARCPGFVDGLSPEFAVSEGEERRGIPIALGRGAVIRGRVLDRGGLPLEGVQVAVWDEAAPGHREQVLTGSGGEFQFRGMSPGRKRVHARKRGYRETEKAIAVSGTEPVAAELVLPRECLVEGLCLDSRGRPLADVLVMVRGAESGKSAKSDGAGRFSVGGLGEGPYWLLAFKAGHRPVRFPLAAEVTRDLRVTLPVIGETPEAPGTGAGPRLRGRITRKGDPVAGALVCCVRERAGSGEAESRGGEGTPAAKGPVPFPSASTDESGRYELVLPEAGTYRIAVIEVLKKGIRPEERTVRIPPEGLEFSLSLP
jgi:protocatechuate 3,4-dioxygenase beta subunit